MQFGKGVFHWKFIFMLKEEGLEINNSKTEEYTIKIGGDDKWKKHNVLGSLFRHSK